MPPTEVSNSKKDHAEQTPLVPHSITFTGNDHPPKNLITNEVPKSYQVHFLASEAKPYKTRSILQKNHTWQTKTENCGEKEQTESREALEFTIAHLQISQ